MTKTVATYYGCQPYDPYDPKNQIAKTVTHVTAYGPYPYEPTQPYPYGPSDGTSPLKLEPSFWQIAPVRTKTEIAAEVIKDFGELITLLQNKEAAKKKVSRLLKNFIATLADIVSD